ncbi:ABC transporter ATP-binding protein [Aureimonas endophytica]|uniref:ABC transporter ATP-binding protein n=1 Tax=Aureimonas endophytica TaxID=2027858 RepID=A0A917A2H3_9HYPH|nr:ABC transporter ATP-binding protein [Aureimonas endophytica]GGE23153.1 ABC transporter ATP-binding protein [Aureimonas endophytica]
MPAEPLLAVRDLAVSFRTERGLVRAVDGVSFELEAGRVLGLVGESGSGKTQTLLAMLGLITDPNAVLSGSIRFEGEELVGLSPQRLRRIRGRRAAMIFQDPMTALTPVHTVGAQIVEQIRAHTDLSRKAARERAVALLAEVGIPDPARVAERYPHQLSGGMRQRVVIAMAVSCEPALLVADEPTTALDVTVQAQILALIDRLRRDHGTAVVFVTHDLGVVSEIADDVCVMYAGRIVESGPVADLFAAPRHPYTHGLFNSIPPLRGPRPDRLTGIPGLPPNLLSPPEGCAFRPRCAHAFAPCTARPPLVAEGAGRTACFLPDEAKARFRRARLLESA